MAVQGKVALLLGQPEEFYQKRFINGFLEKMFATGYDVCIFAMYIKYQNSAPRETGESNIYSLVNYDLFDAVLVLPDTIQTPGAWERIENTIHERFRGPVLVVDHDSRYFSSIWTDSYTPVAELVRHLIEVHGHTDIAFLTGKKNHPHSMKRLQAYRDEMAAHGLAVREDRIFYGDFWYSSGSTCAEQLLKMQDLPQAIACANDCMAIGVAEQLVKNGVRIPEDIAVVGFDSIPEGQTSPSPVMSAYVPAKSTGIHAGECILNMMQGLPITDPVTEVDFFQGSSCGCAYHKDAVEAALRDKWSTDLSESSFFSLHNRLAEDMLIQNNLQDALGVIYANLYQIKGYDSFHLCMNDQWLTPAELTEGRIINHGYSERMLQAIASYGEEGIEDKVGGMERFAAETLLPELSEEHEVPRAYTFSPLHFEASCFGYAVIGFEGEPRSYDDVYRLWLHAVNCGLESVRRVIIFARAMKRRDPSSLEIMDQQITEKDRESMAEVGQILDENDLTYHFQPIVSAVDGSIHAFEALMCARSPQKISPLQILKYAGMLHRLSDVERATFLNVLQHIEECEEAFGNRRIFINSIPGIKLDNGVWEEIEEKLSRHGGQAVVELTEQSELDDVALSDMKSRYSKLGVGTAVDDYGTGYSNISNLLRYMPNYVKVDRSLLSGIQDSPQKQHFVREIVTFSHDNGINVLAEGVETADELRTVIWLGCDLIQGYYVGRPGPEVPKEIDGKLVEEICRFHKERESSGLQRVFYTGKTGRYSAGTVMRQGYTTICTSGNDLTYRDYVLSGTPGQHSELLLEFKDGYEGRVTLEHLHLTALRNMPCIRLEKGCDVTLVLEGDNELNGGGIEVPEGARLSIQGNGDLRIRVRGIDYCAIGYANGAAGTIEMDQDGDIDIEGNGMRGIAIGGGTAADIQIRMGRYQILQHGDQGVGIGCLEGDADLTIRNCELHFNQTYSRGCSVGSYSGNAKLDIAKCFVKCIGSGSEVTVLGSYQGKKATIALEDMAVEMELRAQKSCSLGAMNGETYVRLDKMSLQLACHGSDAFAFGSLSGEGHIEVLNADVSIRVNNGYAKETMIPREDLHIKASRYDLAINEDVEIDEEIISQMAESGQD